MKKNINLWLGLIFLVLIILIAAFAFFVMQKNPVDSKSSNDESTAKTNETAPVTNSTDDESSSTTSTSSLSVDDYFILYDGMEIKKETGLQTLADMKISNANDSKYNTTYYNYENGKYAGETTGNFGEETFEGVSVVSNVKKIAISEKYDAIPRNFKEVKELPSQLSDLADYTEVIIHSIDLDNDNENEYIVLANYNVPAGEIGDGSAQASSLVMLFDSNYTKIADLVSIPNGFWNNVKDDNNKELLSADDIDYIDIDNDGKMEIIIDIPTYEGNRISIYSYDDGTVSGETDYEVNLVP